METKQQTSVTDPEKIHKILQLDKLTKTIKLKALKVNRRNIGNIMKTGR
jgi:hypothetical protein